MYLVSGIDRAITQKLREKELAETAARQPSGKLSASMLGEPLQWQVLKTLGVGVRVVDDYVLRKFARGKDTEDWFLTQIAVCVKNRQEFVSYRGAIGFIDALIDTGVYGGSFGVLPLEIKSVTNAKFKRIEERREPDDNHLLQGAFYGLAKNSSSFALTYIASDDYRTLTWIFNTNDFKDRIDSIIELYDEAMAKHAIPLFKPNYKWQANLEYNKFPEWSNLNEKEINLALAAYHPDAWENYEAKKKGAGK